MPFDAAACIAAVKVHGPIRSDALARILHVTKWHVARRMRALFNAGQVQRVYVRDKTNYQLVSAWYITGYGAPPVPAKLNRDQRGRQYRYSIGLDDEHRVWLEAGRRSAEERARRVEALGLCK